MVNQDNFKGIVAQLIHQSNDPILTLNQLREALNQISPQKAMPVDFVRWVHIDQVEPNEYNPNSVAQVEMGLLAKSILADGYTQPVVTIFDDNKQKYVIVDGFHRYFTMKLVADVYALTNGYLPVVVIDKPLADRMASTVRHNRARGKHSVNGMANLVFKMLDEGRTDEEICNELGMEVEELLRLKHITGFSKLFSDVEYNRAWQTRAQIRHRLRYESQQGQSDDK
jgi:ParB-like chromosome segregation protein Spo0J